MATDKYELLTNKLLVLMENGKKPWAKSWHGNPCQNAVSGHLYQGRNALLCGIEMLINDWQEPYFLTYRQATEMGWQVKKGSKAVWIKYGETYAKTDKETGDIEFCRAFKWHDVFNINQIQGDGIAEQLAKISKATRINPDKRILSNEEFIICQDSNILHMGDQAFYSPSSDKIVVPCFEHFTNAIAYYSTLIHEHIHRTGHKDRLSRDMSGDFGSVKYAFEELVAELGAVFVCNELGMEYDLQNHANYLNNCITVLRDDNKAFVRAAGLAQKACKFMLENAGLIEDSVSA